VGFALAIGLVSANSSAQQTSPSDESVLRVNVELVQVDAQVLQKKTGRPVGTLTKDDFEVLEDGKPQRVATLSRDELPLSVVLLFDLTESVQPVLKPLGAGALEALNHLKPEDEVAVMVYAAKSELLQDFTTDHEKIAAAIQKASEMKSGENAYFNQAIYEASQQLRKATNPRSRRTIIWLTDNVPNLPSSKQHSEQEAIHEVLESGATVFTLLERSAMSDVFMVTFSKNPVFAPLRKKDPPGDTFKYAERTGGSVMKSSKEEVSTKLAQLIDEIRTRYTLGYYPSAKQPKGTFCELKVRVKPEAEKRVGEVNVRTKKGYYK
jgi:Ca-activated chloride channel family protein